MKYSATLLLALLGLSAASVLQQNRDGDADNKSNFMDIIRKKTSDYLNDDDMMEDDMYNKHMNNMNTGKQADQVFLERQKAVLELLSNMQKDTDTHRRLVQMGNEFDPHQNLHKFNNKEAVIKFLKSYKNNNFLDQNEVFTPTSQHHQNQAAQLFTFMHNAHDWETLKHAAAWARNRFNNDQYIFSFTAAVLNHPSTQGIIIPALYEIIPHSFIPANTMQKIYKAKMEGHTDVTIKGRYTNQNRHNINDNQVHTEMNGRNIGDNVEMGEFKEDTNMWSPHNPNKVFADNDGALYNKAGTAENPENKISYFTEDLGINDLHARFHIQHPVFHGVNKNNNYYTSNMEKMNVDDKTNMEDIRRGEIFYFAHQQLLARYVLERLSNNLPIPSPINFNSNIKTGYNPNLQYANGQAVPARPPYTKFHQQILESNNDNNNARLPNNYQAESPRVYEQRLQQVADSGIVLNKDGTKTKLNNHNAIGVLANLMAAPSSSLNPAFYGDFYSVAKNAIGNIVDPNNQNGVAPGAVSNYATAARDPAYYQLLAKVNQIFNNLQNKQGPYTKEQLAFPGVKIQNVDVSKLVTYFETLNVNVNNAVNKHILNNDMNTQDINMKNIENDKSSGNYNVKFQRLANKPFNYKLTVTSDKTTDAIVRVFLGPKYDSNGQRFTLPQASKYFIQLDQFKVKLHGGHNNIVRNSQESQINVHDPLSFQELWKRVELARQGQQPFHVSMVDRRHHWGLPLRAQLPKGKTSGQQFVLYTIINLVNSINEMSMDMNDSSMEMMDTNMRTNRNRDINMSDESDELMNDNTMAHNNRISNQIRDHRSIGFPLDRPVVDANFNMANQYFKTVTIYNKY